MGFCYSTVLAEGFRRGIFVPDQRMDCDGLVGRQCQSAVGTSDTRPDIVVLQCRPTKCREKSGPCGVTISTN